MVIVHIIYTGTHLELKFFFLCGPAYIIYETAF